MGNEELFQYMDPNDPVQPCVHAYYVDQAILTEEDRLVVMRFGSNDDIEVMAQDAVLRKLAKELWRWCVFYRVDNRPKTPERPWCVPDFNQMYELYDRVTIMFFYRNKHMMFDIGTGNNNKIHFLLENKEQLEQLCEEIWRAATKGRGLAKSELDFSSRLAY